MIRSPQICAHGITADLLYHVQNFVVIISLQFPSNLKHNDGKISGETGPFLCNQIIITAFYSKLIGVLIRGTDGCISHSEMEGYLWWLGFFKWQTILAYFRSFIFYNKHYRVNDPQRRKEVPPCLWRCVDNAGTASVRLGSTRGAGTLRK